MADKEYDEGGHKGDPFTLIIAVVLVSALLYGLYSKYAAPPVQQNQPTETPVSA